MFNINENVLISPYSLLVSIVLLLGVFSIGNAFQNIVIKRKIFNSYNSNEIFFSPIIGAYILLFFSYLIVIFQIYPTYFIKFLSYLLFVLGIYELKNVYKFSKKINKINFKNYTLQFYLILFIFFFLFIISASPISHADAIDYHFLGALNILNLGHFHKEILPMNNNLISIGELIISVGLAMKAEQFGGIIQFSSLLALIPLFKKTKTDHLFLILILTCPITFFLVSSPKPQLLHSISSLLIFVFLIRYSSKLHQLELKIVFPFIISILCLDSLSKYSFHLSSFLLVSYFFYIMCKKKLTIYSLTSIFIIFILLYLPFLNFRFVNFQTGFFELLSSPLPINIYGYQKHHDLLSGGSLSLIKILLPTSLLAFSTTYGPLLIFLFLMINKNISKYKIPITIIFIFIVCVFMLGSNLPRFLFEGFLWLTYIVSIIVNTKTLIYRLFSKLIYLQIFIIFPIYLFYSFALFPGSLSQNLKTTIMKKNANGYELAEWANSKLNDNDILLSTHRSTSLFKNETFSDTFSWHMDFLDERSNIYFDFLKSKKVNRILFYKNDQKKKDYKKCIGKLLHYKEKAGNHVGRNPLNSSKPYKAWIYEFKSKELPNCLLR